MGQFIPDAGTAGYENDFTMVSETAIADDLLGFLNYTAIGNHGTVAGVTSEPAGAIRFTTAGTAVGDGFALHGDTDHFVFNGKEGEFGFRFRYPDITGNVLDGNSFRIGIDDGVAVTDPAVGIFVKSNFGVLEMQAESTNGDQTAAVAGVSTLTSGTTAVKGTWHEVKVHWDGENASSGPSHVVMYVDGEKAAELSAVGIGNAEACEFTIAHWDSDATTTNSVELDIDYVYYWQAR